MIFKSSIPCNISSVYSFMSEWEEKFLLLCLTVLLSVLTEKGNLAEDENNVNNVKRQEKIQG